MNPNPSFIPSGDDFPEPHMGEQSDFVPAGRPLIEGQDATPRKGKTLWWIDAVPAISVGVCLFFAGRSVGWW